MTLEDCYQDAIEVQNIRKLIQIIRTDPVTSCQAEQSFINKVKNITEERMKNLASMHIHPNRMSAIMDSADKQ